MEIYLIMMDVQILAQSNRDSNAQGQVLQVPTLVLKFAVMAKTMDSMIVMMEILSMGMDAHQRARLKLDSDVRAGIMLLQISALKFAVMG